MGLARTFALLVHEFLKTDNIDSQAALPRHQFRQIQWKAVRVVKFECDLAGYLTRNSCFGHFDVEPHRPIKHREPLIQRLVKCLFFAANYFFDL